MPNVLAVDGRPSILAMIVDMLQESSYAVNTASDGAEALEWMREHPTGVILLDLELPLEREFLARLRHGSSWAGIPIVGMTTHPLDSPASRLRPPTLLIKPFRRADLEQALRRALAPQIH